MSTIISGHETCAVYFCVWLLNADNLTASRFCRSFSIGIYPPILCVPCGLMAHGDAEWLDIPSFQQRMQRLISPKSAFGATSSLCHLLQQRGGQATELPYPTQQPNFQKNPLLTPQTNVVVYDCTVQCSTVLDNTFPCGENERTSSPHITTPE